MFSIKKDLRELLVTLLFFVSSVSMMFVSLYELSNPYMFFTFFLSSGVLGIILINKIISYSSTLINGRESIYYLYIATRALRVPLVTFLSFLFVSVGLSLLAREFVIMDKYIVYFNKLLNYVVIMAVAWFGLRFAYQAKEHKILSYIMKNRFSELDEEQRNRNKQKTTNIEVGFKIINVSILLITAIAIVNEATGSVSGILTVGGGLMIVFGLSARDFLSNFFGGFMIFMNRSFDIGDLIKIVDNNIEGYVQEIGWTAVKVETPDKRPLYIPNSLFSKISVENPSRMSNRRISENIVLRHEDFDKVGKVCKEIKKMLTEHQGIDQDNKIIVNMDSFNDGYITLILICFTKTIELEGYHSIKQNILSKTYKIIRSNDADIAVQEQNIVIRRGS